MLVRQKARFYQQATWHSISSNPHCYRLGVSCRKLPNLSGSKSSKDYLGERCRFPISEIPPSHVPTNLPLTLSLSTKIVVLFEPSWAERRVAYFQAAQRVRESEVVDSQKQCCLWNTAFSSSARRAIVSKYLASVISIGSRVIETLPLKRATGPKD